jgi:hypothetical protein
MLGSPRTSMMRFPAPDAYFRPAPKQQQLDFAFLTHARAMGAGWHGYCTGISGNFDYARIDHR